MIHELYIGGIILIILIPMVYYFVEKRTKNILKHVVNTYNSLRRMTAIAAIDRAYIIEVQNGGSNISLGSLKYASIIYEAHSDDLPAIQDDFFRVRLDEQYLRILEAAKKDGFSFNPTSNIQPGVMKRRDSNEGIEGSIVFYLNSTSKKLYYLVIATRTLSKSFTEGDGRVLTDSEYSKLNSYFKIARRWRYL